MVEVVVVVSLEIDVDMAVWSCDAFLVLVAGECALGERFRKEVSFRRLLCKKSHETGYIFTFFYSYKRIFLYFSGEINVEM